MLGHRLGSGPVIHGDDEESRRFIRDLIASGAAVAPPVDGNIPAGVTHLIVGQSEDGGPAVQRARFGLV